VFQKGAMENQSLKEKIFLALGKNTFGKAKKIFF